ncbi:hypothetical protein [Pleurocapsa sp. FMAR1]|uniref:hypothetical protein n=1 Tax=Pleurocapsa sp. FMAR1 TaxID=3040204 RepID=UPI0029C7FFE0|nr:hypothetical protein [Pleurocapsa sp. FMAR1]
MTRTNNKNNLSKENNLVDSAMYPLLLFLVVLTPFEDFILKFLPVSDRLYFYARFLSEGLIYAVFAIVFIRKLIKGVSFSRTPLDFPIIIFSEIVLMSIIVNNAGVFESIVSVRPFIRYIFLFYLIVNINITLIQAGTIVRYFFYTGVAQLITGIVQFISRGAIDSFLQPRASDIDIGGVTKDFAVLSGREIGSIYGAAGDTILFASFITLFLIITVSKMYIANPKIIKHNGSHLEKINSKKENIILGIIIVATVIAIGLTYVRACLFIALIVLTAYSLLKFYNRKRIGIIVMIISLLLLIASISINFFGDFHSPKYIGNARQTQQSVIDNMTGIFSEDYIKVARQQRLGALTDIPSTVIYNKPFLGYGPNELLTIENLNNSPTSFLTKEWTQEGFKDVYWVSIMAFYGIAGLFTVAWMFYRLYKWSKIIYFRTQKTVIKEISLCVLTITLTTTFLLFFNRTIEFRIYGLYFWLFPGLMFNLYSKEKLTTSKEIL